VDLQLAAYVLPAALALGAPADFGPRDLGPREKGLFCESVALVEHMVALADRGGDTDRAIAEINRGLDRRACIYVTRAQVRARTVRFERNIAANHTQYGIYQVQVTAIINPGTEIGDFTWTFSQPLTMYTIREAAPGQHASH
jgi:hypothetical protein